MEHYFGEIHEGKMDLSEIGILADTYWKEIPDHFSYVLLGEYVVMPNHVHGIIIIDGGDNARNGSAHDGRNAIGRDAINRVSTDPQPSPDPSPQPQPQPSPQPSLEPNQTPPTEPVLHTKTGGFAGVKNPMLNDNLSRIIRWYKGRVSFESHKIHAVFEWQARFHDHIIRNDDEYYRIRNYIKNNPANWHDDKFFNA